VRKQQERRAEQRGDDRQTAEVRVLAQRLPRAGENVRDASRLFVAYVGYYMSAAGAITLVALLLIGARPSVSVSALPQASVVK
jgi:hypothetical protein